MHQQEVFSVPGAAVIVNQATNERKNRHTAVLKLHL